MIDKDTKSAVEKALRIAMPFAMCTYPNSDTTHFFASHPTADNRPLLIDEQNFDSFHGFLFNKFALDDKLHAYGIPQELSVQDVNKIEEKNYYINGTRQNSLQPSTDYPTYISRVGNIITKLNDRDEKVVISHVEYVESTVSPIDFAEKYFKNHPDCFRFIFYTPECGLWIGASPELLLKYDYTSCSLTSMSLAGTRQSIHDGSDWDEKNIIEHNIVTHHILNVLKHFEMQIDPPTTAEVKFGDITHLCHHISAKGDVALQNLIPQLSPTPALLGWPRDKAYRLILETESHARSCYGGFVGVKCESQLSLYVNLRSATSSPVSENGYKANYGYNLFSGGGITSRSIPDDEWNEAKLKIQSIKNILLF